MQHGSAEAFPEQVPGSSENSPEKPSVSPASSNGNAATSSGSSSAKPRVSARKIQANRSNSLSSTGPTSRAGKNRVRWNSYEHGLLAKALFLTVIDGEEAAEFYRFLNDLPRSSAGRDVGRDARRRSRRAVKFYVDNVLVSSHTSVVPQAPAYAMINHWGTNSRGWGVSPPPTSPRYMFVRSFSFVPLQ